MIVIMTKEQELQLRQSLKQTSKEDLIEQFVKLRKVFDKTSERLCRVEEKLNQRISLEKLIEEIKE